LAGSKKKLGASDARGESRNAGTGLTAFSESDFAGNFQDRRDRHNREDFNGRHEKEGSESSGSKELANLEESGQQARPASGKKIFPRSASQGFG